LSEFVIEFSLFSIKNNAHACTYARKHACTHARTHTRTHTCMHACMHAWPFYGPLGCCPGLPGWAGTRKVNQEGKNNLDIL